MPTIVEQDGLKLKINANDHRPPHVHVEGRGGSARINLNTMASMGKASFSKSDLKKIKALVKLYRDELMEAWNEFHES